MRVAVTGGAGFIGRSVVECLSRRGHTVVVLDNLRRGSAEATRWSEAVLFTRGDIRSLDSCIEAFAGADVVVHLAAQANVMGTESDPDYAFETNVIGTWNVARAAAEAGAGHLIFSSSREVYGNPSALPVHEDQLLRPHNLYGASKMAGEATLAGLPAGSPAVSVLRLSNVIGPGDRDRVVPNWLSAARAGEPLVMFGGNQELDLVPLDFTTAVIVRLVEGDALPLPVNVGTGTTTRLPDLAHRIVSITGSTSPIEIRPPRGPEVTRFRADPARLIRELGLTPPRDPLAAIKADW